MMRETSASEKSAPVVIAGVDRTHGSSHAQKTTFFMLHTISLALCAYLVFGGGVAKLGGFLGARWNILEPERAAIVFAVTALYWVRHGITTFYLLRRNVAWSEALGLGAMILVVEVGFCFLATGALRDVAATVGPVDYVAIALVLLGSYLNSGSEIQRKWWKDDPANKGKCYTGGLFRWSMHINYLGDSVLFTGWSLLTATWSTLALPAMMTAMFMLYHIPGLDSYLKQRYGDEFESYAKRTKKFIPFVY